MQQTNIHLPEGVHKILSGCMQQDRTAQAALYNLYCSKMMGVCMWYAKNREEAQEILQDGFMRVFIYIHTYKGEGSLESWIRQIMINAALLKFRNNKSKKLYAVTAYDVDTHDSTQIASFLSNYDEKQLLKLIQQLPPVCRMVFSLHVLEGFKHKEIAALLGISESTSKSNLADARNILQRKVCQLQKTAS